MIETKQEDCWY